jgi:hypothetical protein
VVVYDHFHCKYKIEYADEVKTHEIEGGLSPKISKEEWNEMLKEWDESELEAWKFDKATGWGMPAHATIVSFRLAG